MAWSGTPPNQTFSRTTGLQTGTTAWALTKAANRGIESSDHDTHDQDLATSLNLTLLKNGGNKPTADIDWGGKKVTNLGTPTVSTDATTKAYVDAAVTATVNAAARAATTANITIATALNNADTLDGISLATNDRVLVKNQTAPEENGVYVVGVTPARATDFDTYNEHVGSIINVSVGTANAGLSFRCTANTGGTLNTTAISYVQFGTTLSTPISIANGGSGASTAATAFVALKQAATDTTSGVVELATAAEVQSAASGALAIAPDIAASAGTEVAVSDGATITVDFSTGINFAVGALAGNRTLAASNYSGLVGRSGYIKFLQDGTGSRTLNTTAAAFVSAGAIDIVLSTAASAVDFVFYQIVSIGGSAKVLLTIVKAVA